MKKAIACIICIALSVTLLFLYGAPERGTKPLPAQGTERVLAEDRRTDYTDYTDIVLSGNNIKTDSSYCTVKEGGVLITHSGCYRITGKGTETHIFVNSKDKGNVVLILDGADISCADSACIYVVSAQKTIINLAEGSVNRLETAGVFEKIDSSNLDGTVFTKSDLTVSGKGSLSVSCGTAHGIVSKDYLIVTGGNIDITAKKKGLSANDGMTLSGCTLSIKSGTGGISSGNSDDSASGDILITDGEYHISADGDGLHSNNHVFLSGGTLLVSSGDDAIHADRTVCITDGSLTVTDSHEGIEGNQVNIQGGSIDIYSYDDGINSSGGSDGFFPEFNSDTFKDDSSTAEDDGIFISGGSIHINSGGDGVDSNSHLTVSGGTLLIDGPVNDANGPIDYEISGIITGGTVSAIGSSGMALNFGKESPQGSILFKTKENHVPGTLIRLLTKNGNEIFSMTSEKSFSSVVISTPEIKKDGVYKLEIGGTSYEVTPYM